MDQAPVTGALELLGRDHDDVRRLLAALEQSVLADAGEVSEGLVAQLVIAESGHEAVEERYFWPLVRRRVQDGPRLADQAVSQEQ